MRRHRVDKLASATMKLDFDITQFSSQHQKYITSGAISEHNARLMLIHLKAEEHVAFVHMAMTLSPDCFELKLIRYEEWPASRKQLLLDVWFLFEEASAWAGYHSPDDDEFTESCEASRDRLLKKIWGTPGTKPSK